MKAGCKAEELEKESAGIQTHDVSDWISEAAQLMQDRKQYRKMCSLSCRPPIGG